MRTARRYVYQETVKEVVEWAKTAIREHRLQERVPYVNGEPSFPWCLKQYLKHLKFQAQ